MTIIWTVGMTNFHRELTVTGVYHSQSRSKNLVLEKKYRHQDLAQLRNMYDDWIDEAKDDIEAAFRKEAA